MDEYHVLADCIKLSYCYLCCKYTVIMHILQSRSLFFIKIQVGTYSPQIQGLLFILAVVA